MSVRVDTGVAVVPGEVLYSSSVDPRTSSEEAHDEVVAGEGCYVRFVDGADPAEGSQGSKPLLYRLILSSRLGLAQWDGARVSVYAKHRMVTEEPAAASGAAASPRALGEILSGSGGSRASAMGPRPGDMVHIRVTRVNRLFAFGEIIAVNGQWCSNHGSGPYQGGFRGVLRVEDIRPFRPTKDQLEPPTPSLSFQPGDVAVAEVISQSDARQYQLSTMKETCGVVEAYALSTEAAGPQSRAKLQLIPNRRDAMMVAESGAVVPRWCPLLK